MNTSKQTPQTDTTQPQSGLERRQPRSVYMRRRAVAGAGALAATAALAMGVSRLPDDPEPFGGAATDTYIVQPGDGNATQLSARVVENQGGNPADTDLRGTALDIHEQDPLLEQGDSIELPKSADIDPDMQGIQLGPPPSP